MGAVGPYVRGVGADAACTLRGGDVGVSMSSIDLFLFAS